MYQVDTEAIDLIVLWRHGWILKDEKNLRKCRM